MRRAAEGRRAPAAWRERMWLFTRFAHTRLWNEVRQRPLRGFFPFLPPSLPLFLFPSLLSPLSSLFLSFEKSPKRPPGTYMLSKPSPTDGSWGKTVSNPFHLPCPSPHPHPGARGGWADSAIWGTEGRSEGGA